MMVKIKGVHIGGLIIAATLMAASSVLRAFLGGSIMVDAHALTGVWALFIYILFCGSLAAYSWALYAIWEANSLSISQIRQLSYVLVAVFCFMLPMLSNDVFSLLTYGDLANKGVDIFSQAKLSGNSLFLQYCNPDSGNGPNVYGPVCIAFMQAATFFFSNNIIGALLAFKLITFIWAILFIGAGFKIAGLFNGSSRPFLFIALNPLFLLEGVGQQHVDLLAAALALWAVYFVLSNKAPIAFIPIAFAVAVKMSYVLLLPYAFIALYLQQISFRSLLPKVLTGIGLLVSCLILVYWPYFSTWNTLIAPFNSLYSQTPTKSIVEVFGDIVFYASQLLHPTGAVTVTNAMTADAVMTAQKQHICNIIILICRVVAITTSAYLFLNFFKNRQDKTTLTSLYLRLLLLFLLFFSHVIYPWYLLLALPFAWFEKDSRFMVWLFLLTCFCHAQGIMCAVARSSWVYALVVPLIAINVFIFFWRFYGNFVRKIR